MKLKNLIFKLSFAMCSLAMVIAVSSVNDMCIATVYQPKAPKSLDKYRKDM